MIRKLLFLPLSFVLFTCLAKDNLNNLFEENIEYTKTKAKNEHKGIFILYYADWCGFCQKIFNETLPDEAVLKALKAGFVCYKVQNSSEEGTAFKAEYDIRSLPTLLFFDENGELVLKQAGMQTKSKLFALINKVYEDYYRKNTPKEFSFTPNLIPSKKLISYSNNGKSLIEIEEANIQATISKTATVACTGTGSCDDNNACTTNDVCVNNVCVGSSITCPEDNNSCTTAACSAVSGCYFVNNTSTCNDGNPCTLNDVCSNGTCVSGSPKSCNDGNACTTETCNPANGDCTITNNTNNCNDGNACTVNDVCAGGACTSGTPRVCNDNNACTDDSCNPATGCVFTNDNSNTCSDNNVCTINDQCTNGTCTGTDNSSACPEDTNICTTKICNPENGCGFAYNSNACDDGNPNTTDDACSLGVCVGQPIPVYGELTPSGFTIPKLPDFPSCSSSKKSFMFYHAYQNVVYVCDGSNWVELDNHTNSVFETSLATPTQSIAASNSDVTIDFGRAIINIGSDFDSGTNTYIAEKDGFYHFDVSTCLSAISGVVLTIEIVDQNGNVLANQRTTSTSTTQLINCSVSKKLSANDSVKVIIKQSDNQTRTISASCTRFSGYRVY